MNFIYPSLLLVFSCFYMLKSSLAQVHENQRLGEVLVQLKYGQKPEDLIKKFPSYTLKEVVSNSWNIYLFEFDASEKQGRTAINELRGAPAVRNVQPNHRVELRLAFPDDARFDTQWGMHNSGANNGKDDADIDAPEAWELTTGGLTATGDTIVVAVIDGGFQLNHEDLDFWINYHEIPGNGIDDDNNGYVDDYYGWNAMNNTPLASATGSNGTHGTHVAGIVGAKGNNEIGVAGVNWNVKIMAIRGSSGDEATVIRAYSYVFDQRKLYNETDGEKGAFVVSTNASFGVDFGNPEDFPLWCGIYDSLGTLGILNAGATANRNINVDLVGDIPTACESPFMISVTNTTRLDNRNSGAAFGAQTIDLGAPGTDVVSSVPTNNYSSQTGTSMATPHVAGAIALMWSAASEEMLYLYKKVDPGKVALFMKEILLGNVDKIPALDSITTSGGRLNLNKAVNGVIDFNKNFLVPVVTNDTSCYPRSFILKAISYHHEKIVQWIDSSGSVFYSGNTYVTPELTESTTFFAVLYDTINGITSERVPVQAVLISPEVSTSGNVVLTADDSALLVASGGINYQWFPSDGLSNTDADSVIASPILTTTYFVIVTDQNGCITTDSVKVTVVPLLNNPLSSCIISPNPSVNRIKIEFSSQILPDYKLQANIYNILGQNLYSSGIITNDPFFIERGNIAEGIYFLVISSEPLRIKWSERIVFRNN
jgi:subtilisin family serine protease